LFSFALQTTYGVFRYAAKLKKARANTQKTQLNRTFSVILRKLVRRNPVMPSIIYQPIFLFHGMIAHCGSATMDIRFFQPDSFNAFL